MCFFFRLPQTYPKLCFFATFVDNLLIYSASFIPFSILFGLCLVLTMAHGSVVGF